MDKEKVVAFHKGDKDVIAYLHPSKRLKREQSPSIQKKNVFERDERATMSYGRHL